MFRKVTAGLAVTAAIAGVGAGSALAARHSTHHAKPAAVSADRQSRDAPSRDMSRDAMPDR